MGGQGRLSKVGKVILEQEIQRMSRSGPRRPVGIPGGGYSMCTGGRHDSMVQVGGTDLQGAWLLWPEPRMALSPQLVWKLWRGPCLLVLQYLGIQGWMERRAQLVSWPLGAQGSLRPGFFSLRRS